MQTLRSGNALYTCKTVGIHEEIIKKVQQCFPQESKLHELGDFFKLFADSTRVRILWALSEAEMCVCDLCALLNMNQPAISHQLKRLKLSGVVKTRREGVIIFYSLADQHIRSILDMGMDHICE